MTGAVAIIAGGTALPAYAIAAVRQRGRKCIVFAIKGMADHPAIELSPGDLLIMSAKGQVIRLPFKSISSSGRATQGVRLMRFKEEGDKVVSVTML